MRILIADDDEIALAMLAHTLTQSGYDVETATDGRQALAKLREGCARLVISDWEMPHLSGIELCQAVREGFDNYIYVILLTGRGSRQETIDGLSAGADDFIKKPFDPAELIVRVRAGERVLGLETRDVTIFALARLAESRDPETGEHLERVRDYCRALAQQLGRQGKHEEVDAEFVRLIYATSPLHDIGKVGIPDSVLLKPGLLSDAEFAVMKNHALLGAQTLDAALGQFPQAQFLRMARDIAATHHERWDGSGYPHGLSGEQIPLCGRIVALADVYDALTSKRVYKAAYCHDVTRSIILEGAGSHFDPAVVQAFRDCERQIVSIAARYGVDVGPAAESRPSAEVLGAAARR